MFITDPEEIKSVARHRWHKQYFTRKRKRKLWGIGLLWAIVVMALLSFDVTIFLGLGVFIVGYLIAWRWTKRQSAQIDMLVEKMQREG